jgi:hypothetical protein
MAKHLTAIICAGFGCVLLAAALGGCGGTASSTGAPNTANPSPRPGAQVYLTEVNGNSSIQSTIVAALRLSDVLNNTGNAPTQVIESPVIANAQAIALDAALNIYVTDEVNAEIFEFPATANGADLLPTRTIKSTGILVGPRGIVLDKAGNIYVSDPLGGPQKQGAVDVYGSTQISDVVPQRQISGGSSGLSDPVGIGLDAQSNIYVVNFAVPSVEVFGSSSTTPVRTIVGPDTGLSQPIAIAVDGAGTVYALNQGSDAVTVYAPGATGDVKPTRTIAGASTGIATPQGIALDSSSNVWVTNLLSGQPGMVTVFAAGANGDVAPMARVTGNASNYTFHPFGITILAP